MRSDASIMRQLSNAAPENYGFYFLDNPMQLGFNGLAPGCFGAGTYLDLQSLGGRRNVPLILVFGLVVLQLLVDGLIRVLVMFLIQVQAALLVQVFSGHELRAAAGAPLGQLVHAVGQGQGWGPG